MYIYLLIFYFYSSHTNTDFRMEIAARNCGFRSIASVGAQIYGSVSSDAHAASGRKQLFAACLRCDRPAGGRNRLVNDGAIFYESTEKTGQSAVCIQKNLPCNLQSLSPCKICHYS